MKYRKRSPLSVPPFPDKSIAAMHRLNIHIYQQAKQWIAPEEYFPFRTTVNGYVFIKN